MRSLLSKWMFLVLGAAGLGLVMAVVGTFLTKSNLLEAAAWVEHTSDVQLAIADCRRELRDARLGPDRDAARMSAVSAAQRLERLTADNPGQQARAALLLARLRRSGGEPEETAGLDGMLRELAAVEDTLKGLRMGALARSTRVAWLVLYVSAGLTSVLIAVFVMMLIRQSRALVKSQATATQESAMLLSVMESMVDGVMAIAPDRRVLHYNRAALKLLGEQFPHDALPADWRPLLECTYEDGTPMHPDDGALARAVSGKSTDDLVYKVRQLTAPATAGTWISATGRPVRDTEGGVIAGVAVLRDISEQKRHRDELQALSISDELTKLNNRRGFLMLAEQHARVSQRRRAPFAIVFVDLNGLKQVNDTYGHEAGDRLICAAANIIRDAFRESDILARLGGDEFVALLPDANPDVRETLVARLEGAVAKNNMTSSAPVPVSFSFGIAFFDPLHPAPVAELMVEADRLMYENKRQQRQARAQAG
jgi:diguanylate cyclase (GGDEF)-like protein